MRLNTFGVFSGYDKTLSAYSRNSYIDLRIRGNKLALSSRQDDFKETVLRKNGMGDYTLALEEQLTNFIFHLSLKKNSSLRL
jgi:hypothetical protein